MIDYVKSLPSLKKFFDQEMEKRTSGKDKKEVHEIIKEANKTRTALNVLFKL